jgi:flavin reductase (DIM6/NTAB) family NADH-FMN oxidoreductase RutF
MPSAIDPVLFRDTLGHYPTGVAVVTAVTADGRPAGMVVGTFSSVSLDPPLITFFPATDSRSFAYLRTAPAFCINVLAADQDQLCQRLASGGPDKFDGVDWRPGPLGSPILGGVLSWLECTFEDVRRAGDHYIVLGRVQELAVERSSLPLLFFQGGYGRFSPASFVAAPDPELIRAAQLAQGVRAQIEDLSGELGLTCDVLVKIWWDVVQVLEAGQGAASGFPLGHRQPLVPPLGAAFLMRSSPAEVDEWLLRGSDQSQEGRDSHRARLDEVRSCGYTLLAADRERLERQQSVLSEFELSDRLPRRGRAVQQAIDDLTDLYCPALEPGRCYDVESIVVPIPASVALPTMAIRVSGMPLSVPTQQIESWISRAKRTAADVGAAMDSTLG